MPDNSESYSHRLLKIYSLFGALYLKRTGGVTEMREKTGLQEIPLVPGTKQKTSSSVVRYPPCSRAWLDHCVFQV